MKMLSSVQNDVQKLIETKSRMPIVKYPFQITTVNLLCSEITMGKFPDLCSWTLMSTMGVKFTPIVNHIVDVEMVLSTMGLKFNPIVDKITASKLHFFVLATVVFIGK